MEQSLVEPAARKSILPYLALASGILCLSLSGLFVRWADAPGPVTSFYRMAIASVLILPFFVRKQISLGKIQWRWLGLAALGGAFTVGDHGLWALGLGYTTVANATLLNYVAPLWVALFAWLVWKQRLGKIFWAGLALTFIGMAVVLANDWIASPHVGKGDLLALASSLFYGAYFLVTQKGRGHLETLSYIWPVVTVAALGLLVFNLGLGFPLTGYTPTTYVTFLMAALVAQICGYFTVIYALGHLKASVVSPTMVLQPVLSALLAVPLAGEPLQLVQILGGLAVVVGIYWVNRGGG